MPKSSVLSFQQRYGSNPSSLYSVVKNCLVKEAALVRNAEMTASGGGHCVSAVATEIMMEIDRHLGQLKAKTQDCDGNITKTRQDQESHSINYYKHHQLSGPFQLKILPFGNLSSPSKYFTLFNSHCSTIRWRSVRP